MECKTQSSCRYATQGKNIDENPHAVQGVMFCNILLLRQTGAFFQRDKRLRSPSQQKKLVVTRLTFDVMRAAKSDTVHDECPLGKLLKPSLNS